MHVIHDAAVDARHAAAKLSATVRTPRGAASPTGHVVLGGALVYVPTGYRADRPGGLLVMFHGAGGTSQQAIGFVQAAAEQERFIVVAPKAAASSWDCVHGGFGPDVAQLDRALQAVFEEYAVDPARIAVGGFSDGASYALTIGLANGALFRAVLAYSPGFEMAPRRSGRPRIFISHGVADRVLSIDATSRRLRPTLEHHGYPVEYVEFAGGHAIPDPVLAASMTWWLRTPIPTPTSR
ncbi:MAG: phospholipase [Myxococcota bacterium]|nr:phospholipase [Myxococcota bacterium]